MITQTYDLNLIPGGAPLRVPVSQYDAGSRDIIFNLYSGSAAFSVPTGATVTVDGTKPDGHGFSYPAAASGNTVTVTVTAQMTAVPGNAECQLTVMQSGQALGSANFLLTVERAALPDTADLSETEIRSIETWKNQAFAAADAAEKSHAQAANSAQNAADSAEAAQNWAENASNHTHSADKITSGTLSATRLPTVPVTRGGTGKTAWTANRIPYLSGSTAFTQLPHPTAAGSFLRQNTSGAPYWTAPAELRSAIGAAPSGYGLGEEPVSQSSLEQMYLPGFYGLTGSHAIPPLTIFGDDVAVVLVERAGSFIKQTVTLTSGNSCAIRWGTQMGNTLSFTEWEWENPPMTADMEYKTTERWRNSPVYTAIVSFGTLPNNSSKEVKSIAAAGAAKTIRCDGEANGLALPYGYGQARIELGCVGNQIRITTNFDATAFSAHVQIWYIKN